MTYPTKGIELVVPSIAERDITGWLFTVNFNRRNHDYSAKLYRSGWAIERDGKAITRWDDLPAMAQKIIVKAKANYGESAAA